MEPYHHNSICNTDILTAIPAPYRTECGVRPDSLTDDASEPTPTVTGTYTSEVSTGNEAILSVARP